MFKIEINVGTPDEPVWVPLSTRVWHLRRRERIEIHGHHIEIIDA